MEACPDLKKAPETTKLSEVLTTVTQNYGQYHECSIKVNSWIEWYNTQRKIFEEVKWVANTKTAQYVAVNIQRNKEYKMKKTLALLTLGLAVIFAQPALAGGEEKKVCETKTDPKTKKEKENNRTTWISTGSKIIWR